MPIRLILIVYTITWGGALIGNAAVELARLRSDRGVAAWVDYTGFALTFWLILPVLPLVALAVSLKRKNWLSATLKAFPAPTA